MIPHPFHLLTQCLVQPLHPIMKERRGEERRDPLSRSAMSVQSKEHQSKGTYHLKWTSKKD